MSGRTVRGSFRVFCEKRQEFRRRTKQNPRPAASVCRLPRLPNGLGAEAVEPLRQAGQAQWRGKPGFGFPLAEREGYRGCGSTLVRWCSGGFGDGGSQLEASSVGNVVGRRSLARRATKLILSQATPPTLAQPGPFRRSRHAVLRTRSRAKHSQVPGSNRPSLVVEELA